MIISLVQFIFSEQCSFFFLDILRIDKVNGDSERILGRFKTLLQMFAEILGPLLYKPQHMKNLVNSITVIVPISNMPNSVSPSISK